MLGGAPGRHVVEGSRLGAGSVLHTGDLARWVKAQEIRGGDTEVEDELDHIGS